MNEAKFLNEIRDRKRKEEELAPLSSIKFFNQMLN